jgi:hypothetical protein
LDLAFQTLFQCGHHWFVGCRAEARTRLVKLIHRGQAGYFVRDCIDPVWMEFNPDVRYDFPDIGIHHFSADP